jgi:hypothetical protein
VLIVVSASAPFPLKSLLLVFTIMWLFVWLEVT